MKKKHVNNDNDNNIHRLGTSSEGRNNEKISSSMVSAAVKQSQQSTSTLSTSADNTKSNLKWCDICAQNAISQNNVGDIFDPDVNEKRSRTKLNEMQTLSKPNSEVPSKNKMDSWKLVNYKNSKQRGNTQSIICTGKNKPRKEQ